MKFHPYQIIVATLAVIMLTQSVVKFVKRQSGQTLLKFSTRMLVWGGMFVIAIFPNISNLIADSIGMKGNVNAVILTGFILVFLMIFKLLSAIERLEQNMTELTRQDALKQIKEKDQQ